MSEAMNRQNTERGFRRCLLTTASSLALIGSLYGSRDARAEDADRPTVWIQLGGQLEQMSGGQEEFVPPFVANMPNNFFSPLNVQKPLQFSIGGEGSISFEPEGSDWVFSASVLYGRSTGSKHQHQQTPNPRLAYQHIYILPGLYHTGTIYGGSHVNFEDARSQKSETHAVVDFQAGKDVGLGLFGNSGSSVLSVGVRFAQFVSKSSTSIFANTDVHYPSGPPITNKYELYAVKRDVIPPFHSYAGMETDQRNFRGVGPSLAWKASAFLAGNSDSGGMTLDWGANAAVLFGRQQASGHHQTTAKTIHKSGFCDAGCGNFNGPHFQTVAVTQHSNAAPFNRERTVIVPNLGGFAGITFRRSIAKISLGYRADFFLGAMDGGIDTARKENVGFHGPFAAISIGLGG